MQANKAMVQRLKRQLAEQQTKSDVESAARCSEIGGLQQRLASKTQQHDRLAEDYKNGLQVCFYIMCLLMYCDDKLRCRLSQ